ncbi:MAG: DUF4145 domain-containing protein, partial [Methanobacteriota archaeon]
YAARESGRELQSLVWVGGGGCADDAAAANAHVRQRITMIKKKLVKCPVCGVKVREDRLERHKRKHTAHTFQAGVEYKQAQRDEGVAMIRTKVMKELAPGKFFALGFGDVVTSNLDGVIVSSFCAPNWVAGSAIEAISHKIGRDYLSTHWPNGQPGDVHVIDVSGQDRVQFDKLFVVFMNYLEPGYRHPYYPDQDTWLSMGLRNLETLLRQEKIGRVDITALGTQYGGLGRKDAFEMLAQGAVNLFSKLPKLDLIRVTTNDLDTFIDFFEALYKIPAWNLSAPLEQGLIETIRNVDFRKDLDAIWSLLERGKCDTAISVCRTTLEKKVKGVYASHGWAYPGKLFNAVEWLKSQGILPLQIGTYFDVVRKLGNFTVHADATFAPTRRDAEIVFFLTLRVIEWSP